MAKAESSRKKSGHNTDAATWRKVWLIVFVVIAVALVYRYYNHPHPVSHHTVATPAITPVNPPATTPITPAAATAPQTVVTTPPPSHEKIIYLGTTQTKSFAGGKLRVTKVATQYRFPKKLSLNQWALRGKWQISSQNITAAAADTAIKVRFSGQRVYLVADSVSTKPIKLRVLFNSVEVAKSAGSDVHSGLLTIDTQRTYQVLNFSKSMKGTLTLIVKSPDVRLYKFTVE